MNKLIIITYLFTSLSAPAYANFLDYITQYDHEKNQKIETIFSVSGSALYFPILGMTYDSYARAFKADYSKVKDNEHLVKLNRQAIQRAERKVFKFKNKRPSNGVLTNSILSEYRDDLEKLRKKDIKLRHDIFLTNNHYQKVLKTAIKSRFKDLPKSGMNMQALREARFLNIFNKIFISSSIILGLDVLAETISESRAEGIINNEELKSLENKLQVIEQVDEVERISQMNNDYSEIKSELLQNNKYGITELMNKCIINSDLENIQDVVTCMNTHLPYQTQFHIDTFCEDESLQAVRDLINTHMFLIDGGCDSYYNMPLREGAKGLEHYNNSHL